MKTLRFFLVLTFIWSGMCCLSYLMFGLTPDTFREAFMAPEQQSLLNEASQELLDTLFATPRWSFFLLAALYALSVVGAAFMWQKNRIGLHLYILAQVLLFVLPHFLIGTPFDYGDAMISLMFIAIYYWSLKKIDEEEATDTDDTADDDDTDDDDDDDDVTTVTNDTTDTTVTNVIDDITDINAPNPTTEPND